MAHRIPRSDTKPVHLSRRDRRKLEAATSSGQMPARVLRRVRALVLLADGWAPVDVPAAVGCGEATVRRVRQRFEAGGIAAVLEDAPKPGRAAWVSKRVESRIVAMVCGPPPEGCSRWTVRLATEEAIERGIVEQLSRERVRLLLRDHDLKPWREKNVVRSHSR